MGRLFSRRVEELNWSTAAAFLTSTGMVTQPVFRAYRTLVQSRRALWTINEDLGAGQAGVGRMGRGILTLRRSTTCQADIDHQKEPGGRVTAWHAHDPPTGVDRRGLVCDEGDGRRDAP